MYKEKYFLLQIVSLSFLLIFCLIEFVSCNNIEYRPEIYTPVNTINNKLNHYCFVNGKNYIDFYVLSNNGKLDYIVEHKTSDEYKVDTEVYGMTSDENNIYYFTHEYRIMEDNQIESKTKIYRMDIKKREIYMLTEWYTPKSGRNNMSLQIFGEYLYFFKENEYGSNDICRIKKDGDSFEKLTDNPDSIYTGIFFIDDSVFYQKDRKLYKTTLNKLEDGELFCENVYTIELYNGYFYCMKNADNVFFRVDPKDPNSAETIITDMYRTCYLIKDDIIYYAKYDPKEIGIDLTYNIKLFNETQGQIYAYYISTGENKPIFQNEDINFLEILNINNNSILANANTNKQIIDSNNGTPTNYYIIPLDGSEPYLIENPNQNY